MLCCISRCRGEGGRASSQASRKTRTNHENASLGQGFPSRQGGQRRGDEHTLPSSPRPRSSCLFMIIAVLGTEGQGCPHVLA